MTKEYKNWLFVEVPEGAQPFGEFKRGQVEYSYRDKQGHMNYASTGIPLIPGQWSIVGIAREIGEEECSEIVEGAETNFGYKDYEGKQASHFYATESLASLIESMGMKNNCTLILKKM